MYLPASTYRLQFNSDFNFKDLQRILPYIISLGPGALYASPIFRAVPGSNHGYDVTNPLEVNPEIGNSEEYSEIIKILKKKQIGWLQDIVPNHMAFHPDNEWLMDVMRFGKKSEYADFFDIDWNHPVYKNKAMVPVLADSADNVLKNGQITVRLFDTGIWVIYGDFRLPVDPVSLNLFSERYPDVKEFCKVLNADNQILNSFLREQHYVLTHWQESDKTINYRRFFTINGLISLKMENNKVYRKYHQLIFKMAEKNEFNGIRLDHVDGLEKPVEYFNRLREDLGSQFYIISEKILAFNEKSDAYWPVQGTTGYDFMSTLNSLFTGKGMRSITNFYISVTGRLQGSEQAVYYAKHNILENSFTGDLDNIYRKIIENNLLTLSPVLTEKRIKDALKELLVCCPVYKLYSDTMPLYSDDRILLDNIFRQAKKNKPQLRNALSALQNLFHDENPLNADLFLRLMQYTGPLMAKGVEDTAMYTWVPNIARNEVGDSLSAPFIGIKEFHDQMVERRKTIPASLNATATHDTKRGEDTRARLSVITDIPDTWKRFYNKWSALTGYYVAHAEKSAPDENERYFICQVILGSIPMNGKTNKIYLTRLKQYIRKALREAKINTNWIAPDENYENKVLDFCTSVLIDKKVLDHTVKFLYRIREYGIINSLSQVILKCTCPGIPDFFQGTELWDFSFVDPDNRRPVDYVLRKNMLDILHADIQKNEAGFFDRLYRSRFTGGIKLWLIHRLMNERFKDPIAFVDCEYIPLKVTGTNSNYILAYLRVYRQNYYAVIVPLHLAAIGNNEPFNELKIHMPIDAPETWYSLWDNRIIRSNVSHISGKELKKNIPLVLKAQKGETERGSGMLMHITSLPGKYGNGSLGQEAYDFMNLLKMSGQKYWQFLPFNPPGTGNSPYSSTSAFAGNVLFIDPVILFRQRRIKKLPYELSTGSRVDFKKSMALRQELFREVYQNFRMQHNTLLKKYFEEFCSANSYWLDDFAQFSSISDQQGNEWMKWPASLKNHQNKALRAYSSKFEEEIEQKKFIQYLFHEQFSSLKSYGTSMGICLIGDIPFYVSYNSADVWSHRDLFNLNEDGSLRSIAGVPPDFFSHKGQLWNMPVYNWKKLGESNYLWWIQRITRNLVYSDLLRMDHFRALSSYWEVPAVETSARKGKWIAGPGVNLLNALKSKYEKLPIIAEDLGDIDDDVFKLRDLFGLPGMKVLLFAFDAGLPRSFHIPHNYPVNSIAYTGTHDNNTVKGWYTKLNAVERERIDAYINKKVTRNSISWDLIRLALTSVSRISVIPVQDVLMLDDNSRMNVPAQVKGNWTWKLNTYDKLQEVCDRLMKLTHYSGRI